MSPKEKANKLANKFVFKSVFDMTDAQLKKHRILAKQSAAVCVDEIIEAIKTTTGHCELRSLDWHEVQSDLKYWEDVKSELHKL